MKYIFFILFIVLSLQVRSQASLLKNHTWKLELLSLDNNEYLVPSIEDEQNIFLDILDSSEDSNGYFSTSFCNYVLGNIEISEVDFSFTSDSVSSLECQDELNSTFDALYIQDFLNNNIDEPFEYSFFQEENWLYLIITNSELDFAKYSTYLNTELAQSTWVFDKLTISNQVYFAPDILNDEITFKFIENDKTIYTSVCNYFSGDVFVSDLDIISIDSALSLIDCEPEINTFDNLYINSFFVNLLDNKFEYNISNVGGIIYLTLTDIYGSQAIYYKQVLSAANTNQLEKNIKIYPNPVEDWLKINGILNENINLEMFDLTGKKLIETKTSTLNNNLEINVSQLEKGLYVIQIKDKNGHLIFKDKFLKK